MKFEDFLTKHMVVQIGKHPTETEYVCCEVIVDNPEEFIPIVRAAGYYISFIRWWDRASIITGSNIGYGGPRDPKDPSNYYFAETDICREFSRVSDDAEYHGYIIETKSNHTEYHLLPAFDIKTR